jgi:hypothetical protein
MELVPIIAITAVGAVGFCLMLAAFVMVGRRGGWQQAMKPDARGHWPAPRLLMLVGAALGAAFGLLLFVPGVVPWWDYSSPSAAWGLGVVFGFGLGFGVGILSWRVLLARRGHARGADRGPQA